MKSWWAMSLRQVKKYSWYVIEEIYWTLQNFGILGSRQTCRKSLFFRCNFHSKISTSLGFSKTTLKPAETNIYRLCFAVFSLANFRTVLKFLPFATFCRSGSYIPYFTQKITIPISCQLISLCRLSRGGQSLRTCNKKCGHSLTKWVERLKNKNDCNAIFKSCSYMAWKLTQNKWDGKRCAVHFVTKYFLPNFLPFIILSGNDIFSCPHLFSCCFSTLISSFPSCGAYIIIVKNPIKTSLP